VILEIFAKKAGATPKVVIAVCQKRLKQYSEE
jgi:phage-related protein